MRLRYAFLSLFLMFAVSSQALAGVRVYEDGAEEGNASEINLSTGLNGVMTGGKYVVTTDTSPELTSIIFEGATADAYELTLASADPTADVTVTLPAVTGTAKVQSATSALTAGAAVSLTVIPGSDKLYTDTITTDNEDQTITFSGAGTSGDRVTIKFTTDTGGSGDEVITFHSTLVNSVGTLTLANATADVYVVSFISDGTKWNETARTAIQVT